MANEASDIVGYAVLNAGLMAAAPGGQCYFPLLRGSRFVKNPALASEDVAQNLPETSVWTQGVTMPALMVRTPVFGGADATNGWFTAKRMNLALLPDTAAAGTGMWGAPANWTGLIKTSLGTLQYQLADNQGDSAAVLYNACKMASFRLDWDGQNPVIATFLLMLYGGTGTAKTQTELGTGSGQPQTGAYFMSQGVTYASTVTDVIGGSLSIDLSMRPDLTTPLATLPNSTTGASGPNNYFNDGSPRASLDLVQKKGAASIGPPSSDEGVGTISLVFADKGGPSGSNKVTFVMKSLFPVVDMTTGIQLARVRRSYSNIKPDGGTSAFSLAIS